MTVTSSAISRQFALFIVAGGIAATVNFLSRIALNRWLDYSTSIIIAYVAGMITAFFLTRHFVFGPGKNSAARSVFYFSIVNLLAVAQTWIVSMLLVTYLFPTLGVRQYSPEIAHAIGIVVPTFTSYIGHRYWSFR